ncbi:hypothetical protein AB0P15_13555 [Streptomyces sp. NPDC087917]|uniref:hypothetical protein n=1 Tax=unclassified Streptomyces TaxID=2593676 RepID=UPI00341831DC
MDITKTPAPTAPEDKTAANTPAEATGTGEEASPATDAADAGTVDPAAPADSVEEFEDDDAIDADDAPVESSGVAAAATSLVAAGLALVALSGTWVSRVVAERQTLIGQIESVNAASAKEKIAALYGDAWHMTALVNGVVSTLALLLAVFVLARPAFGAPGRVLPVWVRSVSWATVALALVGVLLFGFMYFDLLSLPTAAE